MLENNSLSFLILNASIVWLIVAYAMMMLLRSKILFICLLILPFIVAPSFSQHQAIAGWMHWYLQSLIYGAGGILVGIVLAQISQTKRLITSMAKGSFFIQIIARFTIGLAGLYVLIFFIKRIAGQLPFVDVALGYIIPGTSFDELFRGVNMHGVFMASGIIATGFIVLFASKYIPVFTTSSPEPNQDE